MVIKTEILFILSGYLFLDLLAQVHQAGFVPKAGHSPGF